MVTAGFHGHRTRAVCSWDQERDSQCLIFRGVIRDGQGSRRGWEGEEFEAVEIAYVDTDRGRHEILVWPERGWGRGV